MTEPDDPPRLLDDAGEPAGLQHLLRSAQRDVGTDAEVARLAMRLGPLLGAGEAASVGGGAAASSSAAKVGAVALALLAVGGGAVWLSTRPSAPPPHVSAPPPHVSAPPHVPVPAEVPEPAELPSVVVAPVAPSAAATATVSARLDKPAPLSEAELLEQARAALKGDPSRALQRANEHARRFPRGVLVQEREVLAIQALRRLGRDAEAERRAEAFAKAFPGSAFQRQLKPNP
ncbi:MAG TPA: hypothetical protein VEQ59_09085 [Polyangiaceae bacterium]|nr:hypothetical protein [Polyangiaceae bacterium]